MRSMEGVAEEGNDPAGSGLVIRLEDRLSVRHFCGALGLSIDVCRGDTQKDAIRPAPRDQLPLIEIWGDTIESAVRKWEEKGTEHGKPRNPKTRDKYAEIAGTFGAVLGRRPLQATTPKDLKEFVRLLRARKRSNCDGTIEDKLECLQCFIGQYEGTEDICQAIDDAIECLDTTRSRRLKFTPTQFAALIHGIYADNSLHPSYKHITSLDALTGARLEEICQLTGADIQVERSTEGEDYWLVRIADSAASGSGNAQLKTVQSIPRATLAGK
ncbi:MAG: hypothetical protein JSS14_08360 [Proteobacteria bacterium]|nr:hypothetical protein [Pseudomonadota bacterium]